MARVEWFFITAVIISLGQATLIAHPKSDSSETDLYFKAIFASTSPYPFNIRGRLFDASNTNFDDWQKDLTGIIVMGNTTSSADEFQIIQQVYERNGSGYIAQYPEYVMFFKNMAPIPFVCILSTDASLISDLWEQSNRTLEVTIISDDNYQIFLGRSGGSVFLIVINLTILLATLAFICYQFYSFRKGAPVTKIALVGVLLSNLGLIAERIVTFFLIYTNYTSFTIAPPIAIIGPTFIAFSAAFISLYWSALVFPTKLAKTESKQVFLPVLGFFVLAIVIYAPCLALGLDKAIFGLQIAFVIIILVSATYFIVIGAILIKIVKKGSKITATKRKIPKRLMYMLILAGISMYGIVIVGTFITIYRPSGSSSPTIFYARAVPSEPTYYSTRAMLSLFCTCSVVTLAALFKKPRKSKIHLELKVTTSDDDMKTPNSRSNETS